MRPNCSSTIFEKTLIFDLNFFLNPVKLSVRFSYLVFNEHSFFEISPKSPSRDTLQILMNFIRICLRRLAAGGDEGNRTLDPLLAGQVLSQLSYTPILGSEEWKEKSEECRLKIACDLLPFILSFSFVFHCFHSPWKSNNKSFVRNLVSSVFVFFVSSYERSYSNRPCSP